MAEQEFASLSPDEIARLKRDHVGSNTMNEASYSGPACRVCPDERWPCRVSRLIAMLERSS